MSTASPNQAFVPAFDFLSGGGEMGALVRAHDWASTSLGMPETWPAALKTSLRIILTSNHPMLIWWGPDLLQFYNDAYRQTLGPERHPGSLGQHGKECWAEVWHIIGPEVDLVMGGKGATWHEDTLVPVTRHGKREDVWWTYGYSPIEDEFGVQGVLVICNDVTQSHVLKDNERQSRHTLIESMDQGFCVIEPVFDRFDHALDYRFIEVNPAFERHTGLYNAVNKTALELVPDLERHWIETYGRVALTGEAYRFIEESMPMGRCFDVSAVRIGNPEKRQVALLFKDITEQKRAERELKKTGERQAFALALSDALRNLESPKKIAEIACEILGRKLQVSRVLYAEVDDTEQTVFIRRDWTEEGFVSLAGTTKAMYDFGPHVIADLLAGSVVVNNDVAIDARTAAHTAAYESIGVRADLLVPLIKSGKLRAVLTVHCVAPKHWKSEEIEMAQDTSERTWLAIEAACAQEELRAERDQSKYIFDSMAEGFAVLDSNWNILRMNAEGLRISQRAAHEVIGRNHWEVWPELKGTRIEENYRRVIEARKAEIVEIPYTFPDGKDGWIEVRAHPAIDGGIAFFFRDVTTRKFTQDRLKEADRRKDEFLAMLAHELRNPLAPIGAAAELLQMVKLDEARVRQTSEVIARQVDHMTSLVDDLLDVSRVTRGLVELDKSPQEVSLIITEAIEQVTPLIRSRRHHLGMHMTANSTLVMGDRTRLVQVIANLLNNAAKYTPEGGNILVNTDVCESDILIEISDDGIGMVPELVSRAFDLFAQAERTSDRSSGGLGLGLALVKSLIELHNGTVKCESAGPGKGSKFTVCLPRVLAAKDDKDLRDTNELIQQRTRSLRVMVVDDNVDAAAMLTMLLEASGHQVVVEHQPQQALLRAKTEVPQVCLLDIGLPGMDGNELAQRLRAQPETARSVLIAITGYGQENDRKQTQAAGFNHHFVKPVDTRKLLSILAEISDP